MDTKIFEKCVNKALEENIRHTLPQLKGNFKIKGNILRISPEGWGALLKDKRFRDVCRYHFSKQVPKGSIGEILGLQVVVDKDLKEDEEEFNPSKR